MNEKQASVPQNIILENRRKLSVSGVEDVDSFDESQSIIYTGLGLLEVKGSEIHMSRLNLETGEIVVEGQFDSCIYIDPQNAGKSSGKKGLFARIFQSEND